MDKKVRSQKSEVRSKKYEIRSQKQEKILPLASCLLLLVLMFAVSLTACGKKEEKQQVAVAEKKAEVAPSVETIPAEFAEAYKGVVVVSEVEGVDWQKGVITAVGRGLPPKGITNPAQEIGRASCRERV